MLKVTYGITVAERGDEIIRVIDASMEAFAEGLVPGAFLVEYFPFLRYVPAWLPGAGFQKRLRRWRDASHAMVDMPYERAKRTMVCTLDTPLLMMTEILDRRKIKHPSRSSARCV